MRTLGIILAIPVVAVLLAIILIPLLLDEQKLAAVAASQIEAQTGGTLTIDGAASISLFPTASVALSAVTLTLPDDGGKFEAGTLEAGVALLPILGGSVEIDSILVDKLTVTTVAKDEEAEAAKVAAMDTTTLSNGELDDFYATRKQARTAARARAAEAAVAAPMALEVGELTLREIRVVTVDSAGELLSELRLKYLTATALNNAGRPVPLTAHILMPDDDETIEIMVAGELTADQDTQQVSLNSLDLSITGATPDPIKFQAQGSVDTHNAVADVSINLETGTLQGKGKVRFASMESPQIDARLALTELNPALLVLAGPDAAEAVSEAPAEAPAADIPLPLHALRMIDTQAQLSIEKVIIEGHELTDVDAALRIVDGVATLSSGTATVHKGEIAFTAELNGRYNKATLLAQGGVKSLDVASAVAAMDAGISARGTANLEWDLKSEGATVNTLLDELNGPISFSTEDITVEGIAAQQMLCKGVALVNQETLSEETEFPADTTFETLSADIQLADGIARLNPLTAQLAGVSLGGKGELAITPGELRASFRAQLSQELGELDPACRINERYAALRWPVECKGKLTEDPAGWCSVDTGEILKDLAEGEIKRKVEDKAGKLLNKLFE